MSVHRLRFGSLFVGLTLLLTACEEGEPQYADLLPRDAGAGPNVEVPIGGGDAAVRGDASANGASDGGKLPNGGDGAAANDARTSDAQASAGDGSELDPGSRDAQVGGRDAAQDGGDVPPAPPPDGGPPPGGDGGAPPADGSMMPPPDGSMPPPPDGGMPPPPDGGMPPPDRGMPPPPDGGMPPPPDGGMPPPPDGGRPPGDGGMPPRDGGQPPSDGGPLDGATTPTDASSGAIGDATAVDGGTCTLTANTYLTSKVNEYGCYVLARDTSSCEASRIAAGLSGFWLKFSCRVTLTVNDATQVVIAQSDNQPDYKSVYFSPTSGQNVHVCYEAFTSKIRNPNNISAKSLTLQFPRTPNATQSAATGAILGLALNGVGIFGAYAAPQDDIYAESETFDRCGAHPQQSGTYHYHAEPLSISSQDSNFIGVMRDGHPVYGRYCTDGSAPADLDAFGGHTRATVDSASAVYHYHVNLQSQTDETKATFGKSEWFITKGRNYRGTPGSCTGCN